MNPSEVANMVIRGSISILPKEEQVKIFDIYEELKAIMLKDKSRGVLAMTLLSTELEEYINEQ